ncbi:MAG: portal protein, partial [bacterium]
ADTLTPKAIQWFGFKIPEASPFKQFNDNQNVMNWFKTVEDGVRFALDQSNFYPVINEIYLDFNSFATICLYVEESEMKQKGFNGLTFRALPIASYVFAEDDAGSVDTVMREYELTARQFVQRFPGGKIPGEIAKSLEQTPDDKFNFLRGVAPTKELSSKVKFPYASVDILVDKQLVVDERGYKEFPYMVGRWDKASGETRGRGPAAIALDDIKSLNQLRKLELIGLEKAVNPPILAPEDGFIGTVKLGSNSIIYSRNPNDVRTLPTELRLDLSSLKANDLKQSIRDIYLTDQLNIPRTKQMTASEVSVLRSEMERLLGPTISRFESEVLGPMLNRTVGIMHRTGALPPPPPEIQDLDAIDIEYVGQLARSQKMVEVESIQNWISLIGQFGQIDPRVLQLPDLMAAGRIIAPVLGVPKSVVKGAAQMEEDVEREQKEQAEAEQMQKMGAMAESAGKAAPAMKVMQDGAANLSEEDKAALIQQFTGTN